MSFHPSRWHQGFLVTPEATGRDATLRAYEPGGHMAAVIFYSATGNVHMLAEAIAEGASETGAEVRLKRRR